MTIKAIKHGSKADRRSLLDRDNRSEREWDQRRNRYLTESQAIAESLDGRRIPLKRVRPA